MPLLRTLSVALVVFLLDRASKWAVVEAMDLALRQTIEVYPPYLTFSMAWNRGINFGLLDGKTDMTRYLLIGVALLIVAGLLVWVRNKGGWIIPLSAGLVIGGALGNVLDRFIYGAVADFLNMSCCGIANPYAFNVADVAIFAGALGLILFGDKKPS